VETALTRDRSGVYVACFSRTPDSLPQWRGYAGGRGYAIGFNTRQFPAFCAPLTAAPPPEIGRIEGHLTPPIYDVIYDESQIEALLRRAANNVANSEQPEQQWFYAVRALALVKQRAYEYEQEIRAFIQEGPVELDVEFRNGPLGVTPYITVCQLPTKPEGSRYQLLHDVWVGPGENLELRQAAAVRLLRARGFGPDEVPVEHSSILFRP
jgi:hypothetical protein